MLQGALLYITKACKTPFYPSIGTTIPELHLVHFTLPSRLQPSLQRVLFTWEDQFCVCCFYSLISHWLLSSLSCIDALSDAKLSSRTLGCETNNVSAIMYLNYSLAFVTLLCSSTSLYSRSSCFLNALAVWGRLILSLKYLSVMRTLDDDGNVSYVGVKSSLSTENGSMSM